MIFIGTSGFSYADWKGYFYPEKISPREMLPFYAKHFNACEINSTYYQLPNPRNLEAMIEKSGGKLSFVVKAHQSITHQRTAGISGIQSFNQALMPFKQAKVLGAILLQFPFSFPNNIANRGYLADCREQLGSENDIVVEFRHRSWVDLRILEWLKKLQISVVNVDEPAIKGLLPKNDWVSGNLGYIRFHGRNSEKWFAKNSQSWERYDYLYNLHELEEWLPIIRMITNQTPNTYLFFNNHWQSQAVINAKQMAQLLEIPAATQ